MRIAPFPTAQAARRSRGARAGIAGLAFLGLAVSTQLPAALAQAPGAPPVTVSHPLLKRVTEWTEFTGQFRALNFVEVRSRVSGTLTEIRFTDGQIVRKGDLLFVIDPRPFEIDLQRAQAQLATAQATLELSTRDVARGISLRREDFIAQSTQDQRVQSLKSAQAQIETANAAIRQAQLNIEFSHVAAPIDGKVGQHQVSTGNLIVGANDGQAGLLTTIVSIDPIDFDFDMSEQDYLAYQRASRESGLPPLESGKVPIETRLADEAGWPHKGRIDFVDNQLTRTSGTIRLRGLFQNTDGVLTSGAFARARVPATPPHDALLIPDAAVATDQSRKLAMTVTADGTVVPKPLVLGPLVDGLRIVRSGLTLDDQIIIDGMLRARPGGKVTPQLGEIKAALAAPVPQNTLQ